MPATQFYASFRDVLDHHDGFGLLARSLEDQVVSLRLLNRQHLDDTMIFSLHHNRKLGLADLALELLEIVVQGATDDLLLYFDVYPLQQAF